MKKSPGLRHNAVQSKEGKPPASNRNFLNTNKGGFKQKKHQSHHDEDGDDVEEEEVETELPANLSKQIYSQAREQMREEHSQTLAQSHKQTLTNLKRGAVVRTEAMDEDWEDEEEDNNNGSKRGAQGDDSDEDDMEDGDGEIEEEEEGEVDVEFDGDEVTTSSIIVPPCVCCSVGDDCFRVGTSECHSQRCVVAMCRITRN